VSSYSIIIASYNSADFLPATIGSCLRQTVPAAEIIVVDDGSTDGTASICAGFGRDIRYVRVENGGVSAARNHGAALADGEWLLFLDSDDLLLPTAAESLLAAARGGGAGAIYGMVIERAEPPRLSRLNGFPFCAGDPPIPAQRNFRRCAIITPGSAIVRRDLFGEVGGFVPGYEPMEDRDFWIKCGLLRPVAFCDTTVLDKTWRPGSAGSSHAKRIYRGLGAQRALPGWCAARGIDYSWIGPDAGLVRDALKDALHWHSHEILEPLLSECRASGYRGLWYYRALLRCRLLALRGIVPGAPAWLGRRTR